MTTPRDDTKTRTPETHRIYTTGDANPHDVTVTYYTTEASTTATSPNIQWSSGYSSCGTDHGSVAVTRMVPEEQVTALRDTITDLYRQLGDEQRRVAALETALRDATKCKCSGPESDETPVRKAQPMSMVGQSKHRPRGTD